MAATDDLRINRALQEKHGLNEDQATKLYIRLVKSRCLDIVDADTGMPLALVPGNELYNDTLDAWPADSVRGREHGAAD